MQHRKGSRCSLGIVAAARPHQRSAYSTDPRPLGHRYELLRTTFSETGGQPRQTVRPIGPVRAGFTDLRSLTRSEREPELDARLLAWVREPFDLGSGPLLRVAAFRLGAAEYLVVLCAHALAVDDASLEFLATELAAGYAAASTVEPGRAAAPALRYADYVRGQRDRLAREDLASQLDYWRARLAGLPILHLPADRARPDASGITSVPCEFRIPAQIARRITETAAVNGGTLFEGLLAVCQTILSRYCREEDIAVATAVPNRTMTDAAEMVGPLTNLVVLRSEVRPGRRIGSTRCPVSTLSATTVWRGCGGGPRSGSPPPSSRPPWCPRPAAFSAS
ncbi:condensation domain-containing protein [Amycolatopsis sp. GA6-003]|uniref:condensation domain-containing protein n=1 Tax=Amycolatopsis sp. GA6-003 TaxID=2652444 RepID=UPI0039175814